MNYLIDTNVISEVRKGGKCDPNVAAWWESADDADIISACWCSVKSAKALGELDPAIPPRPKLWSIG